MKMAYQNLKDEISNDSESGLNEEVINNILDKFYFLTQQLNKRLDEDIPEISYELLKIVAPEQLLPVAPMCLLQIDLNNAKKVDQVKFSRGDEICFISNNVGKEKIRFQISQNIQCLPLNVVKTIIINNKITVVMEALQSKNSYQCELQNLSFYCAGSYENNLKIFKLMRESLTHVNMKINANLVKIDKKSCEIKWNLINECYMNDVLTERDKLLRNMILNPEKFFFVSLALNKSFEVNEKSLIDLEFVFDVEFFENLQIRQDYFKLNCVPALNLYKASSEPIRYDHRKPMYELILDNNSKFFDILKVEAIDLESGEHFECEPILKKTCLDEITPFYNILIQKNKNFFSYYLALANVDLNNKLHVSCEVMVSNDRHAREAISENSQGTIKGSLDNEVSVTALIRPTLQIDPPQFQDFHWRLLSNFNLFQTSNISIKWLKNLLSLYNWHANKKIQRKIDSLKDLNMQYKTKIIRGCVLNVMVITILISESDYVSSDEVYWFCDGLKELFKFYTTFNTFLEVRFILSPSYEEFGWHLDKKTINNQKTF